MGYIYFDIYLWFHFFSTGPPGCGKGAMCKKIAERYQGYIHVSVGEALRTCAQENQYYDKWKMIAELILKGDLVSNETPTELLKEKIDAVMKEQPDVLGFVVEGYPRSAQQKAAFEKEVWPS